MRRELISSPPFLRTAKKLAKRQPNAATALREALVQLQADAFDPRLRTHKLKGELINRWSCSVGYDLRVVFRFVQQGGEESILLLSVGTHDEVY